MGVDHGAVRFPKNLEFMDGVGTLPPGAGTLHTFDTHTPLPQGTGIAATARAS